MLSCRAGINPCRRAVHQLYTAQHKDNHTECFASPHHITQVVWMQMHDRYQAKDHSKLTSRNPHCECMQLLHWSVCVFVCRWTTGVRRRVTWERLPMTGVRPRRTMSTEWGPLTPSRGSGPTSPTAQNGPGSPSYPIPPSCYVTRLL